MNLHFSCGFVNWFFLISLKKQLHQPLPQSILQYPGQAQIGLDYLIVHPFGNTDSSLDRLGVSYLGTNETHKIPLYTPLIKNKRGI
jgi:hypothetical protein